VKRFGLFVLGVLSFAAIAGCSKSPTINIPPPPPARMFVANFTSSTITAYTQPLGPTSTASTTITPPSQPDGVATDRAGNLIVPNGSTFYVYAPPASATTAPTVIGPVAGVGQFRGLNFDPSGNLWITDAFNNQVLEFTTPLGAAPIRTIQCACFSFPIEVSVDFAGHIFTTNNGSGTVQVLNVPAATGVSVLAPVATLTSPTGSALGITTDAKDRLLVTEDNANTILIYNPPFGTGNLPAGSIAAPTTLVSPAQLHFDASGNLYVTYQFDTASATTGGIAVFTPPIGSASSPIFTIQGVGSGLTDPVDLTFAP